MANYYDELLKICGFEDEEINRERPRIEKAFQKLELGPEDMKRAEIWVRQNHEVELMGVRKILGIWLKELIDLVLAKDEGKKLVYYGFPTIPGPAMSIAASSKEIYCTCPDVVLCYTLGQIFNKLTPILEAGEENGLPPGHGLCSLQQVRVGGMVNGIIPVPDMVLTSSYYCDMGSKADELLHERYGHPAVYIDGSMDSRWGEYPGYLPERVGFLGGQIEKALDRVKDILGVEVIDEARYEGASRSREVFEALSKLVELMRNADPQPISIVTVELARRLTNGSGSRRIMTDGAKAIAILNQEVQERIDKGIGVVEEGAPRIIIFLAHFSDPRIARMVENNGLSIPITLLAFLAKARKATPLISGKILAEVELERGTFHSNYGFVKLAAEAAQYANVDGVIWNYLFNCRPLSQPSLLLKQFVERETGIPVLPLESDLADSRTYSVGALKTRVETFAEMLRARKASVRA
jgi:benzoyl-CoA reductase/2-hydroxyglutaryl-CoA dehydratase subunit BcrC/BadD/HgdB